MSQAISKDGTTIAYERSGQGPALILVDGALCSRAFGPMPRLAPLLARHFTVYAYDRRGRGGSGDAQPYAKEREVEDIAAVLREAGGPAFVVGLSSGGALALEAAASGLDIAKVVAYEPPFVDGGGQSGGADHERRLRSLLAAGDRAGAVKYFMRSMVGVPAPFVVMLQLMPWIWRKMKDVAHTLPYDAAVMGEFKVPTARLASIQVPTLALHGSKTDARLKKATEAVAEAIPGALLKTLAGQTHNVDPKVLTPAVVEFCAPGYDAGARGEMRAMRFIIMHKTSAHWEAGAIPTPELIARVGELIGELAEANVLRGAEGLRASSEGVRLRFSGGVRTVVKGPFVGEKELPAGFSILRVSSVDEAIEWATRQAAVLGDCEIDIRPVTEAWDIAMAPKPDKLTTRRYMALRKATAATEAGVALAPKQREEMARLVDQTTRTGVHLATETLRPSARGRRYRNSRDGLRVTDGPFTESKEMIAGYVIVSAESLEDAGRWATRYIDAVGADEVDVLELQDH